MPGKHLLHYEILGRLGDGGMGEVFRARDTKLDREVALKVLPPEVSADPERRARFLREAKAVAALQHPNIVTVYSVDEAEGELFLTMELVEGTTLDAAIPNHGMRLTQLLDHAIPLTDAISYAHGKGITHRDLKPTNVMVDDRRQVRVLDFGLAKLLAEPVDDDGATMAVDQNATAEGVILGTAAYMSPEQAQGLPVDARTDIFSLGVLLYEMATGQRPFQGDTRVSTISSVLKDTPKQVTELNASLPRHLGRIIHKCLAKEPENRYQTAQDLKTDLVGLKQETESGSVVESAPAAAPAAPVPAKRSRPAWLPVALIAVGITLTVLIGRSLMGGGDDPVAGADRAGTATQAASTPSAAKAMAERTLIAVLPFQNLGAEEDAYFAAGITEELISLLSGVEGLGVISRQSAARYADSDLTMSEIGEALGVTYVVDGSVRWQKDEEGHGNVRVTPHLTLAADELQVWSDRYDERVETIFAVQERIAEAIVDQVRQTIGGVGPWTASAGPPTDNFEAHQLVLQAKELRSTPSLDPELPFRVIALVEQAVELDPEYGEAWAYLSRLHSSAVHSGRDITEERLRLAREAADRAMALDPGSAHAHLALGYYYYHGRKQYGRAQEEFEKAARHGDTAEVLDAQAYVLRRLGRFEEALDLQLAARVLDPENNWFEVSNTYEWLGRYDEAIGALRRNLVADQGTYITIAFLELSRSGSLDGFRVAVEKTPADNPLLVIARMYPAMLNKDPQALDLIRSIPVPYFDFPEVFILFSQMEQEIAHVLEDEPAIAEVEPRALAESEAAVAEQPRDARRRMTRASVLALADRNEEAVREANTAVDILPISRDAMVGRTLKYQQGLVYVDAGRVEEGVAILREMLADPYGNTTIHSLRFETVLRRHGDHPAVQSLLNPSS